MATHAQPRATVPATSVRLKVHRDGSWSGSFTIPDNAPAAPAYYAPPARYYYNSQPAAPAYYRAPAAPAYYAPPARYYAPPTAQYVPRPPQYGPPSDYYGQASTAPPGYSYDSPR